MRSLVLLVSSLLVMHQAQAETITPVQIEDAYSYATAASQKNGAVFFTVEHQTPGDRLIKAESHVADLVELHTHIMEGEVMKMRKVDALEIPESGTLELKPQADHIMLIGLKEPLVEGQSFPLKLTFEKSGEQTIEVPVVKAGVKPSSHDEHTSEDEGHDHHSHH